MRRECRSHNALNRRPFAQRGFTLIEVLIAMFVLVVGLVAVMQMVPYSVNANLSNRNDSSATVIAQRLRDLMVNQPLSVTTLTDPTAMFPCGGLTTCVLGGGTANGDYVAGCPLLNSGQINFGANPVANYNFIFRDPNDPTGTSYDVRWAVITSVRNVGPMQNVVVAKRYVVGARQREATAQPVSIFSSWVSR